MQIKKAPILEEPFIFKKFFYILPRTYFKTFDKGKVEGLFATKLNTCTIPRKLKLSKETAYEISKSIISGHGGAYRFKWYFQNDEIIVFMASLPHLRFEKVAIVNLITNTKYEFSSILECLTRLGELINENN